MKAIELLKYWREFQPEAGVYIFDEAIAELEEVAKIKSCNTCSYYNENSWWEGCKNFGFSCSSAGFETHIPDDSELFWCSNYHIRSLNE